MGVHGWKKIIAAAMFVATLTAQCSKDNGDIDDDNVPKPLQVVLYLYSISEGPLGGSLTLSAMTNK